MYRHPLNFAVNVDNRDTAKFKTVKFILFTGPTEVGGPGEIAPPTFTNTQLDSVHYGQILVKFWFLTTFLCFVLLW